MIMFDPFRIIMYKTNIMGATTIIQNLSLGTLKQGEINFNNTCVHSLSLSCVQLFVTPWTVAHQALLSMEFSRKAYWYEFPFPTPGNLPYPGIELVSPALAGAFFTIAPPEKPFNHRVDFNSLYTNRYHLTYN